MWGWLVWEKCRKVKNKHFFAWNRHVEQPTNLGGRWDSTTATVWSPKISSVSYQCINPTGDFTKHGQPVPRPDPTWYVGITHFQLWGEGIPHVLKQYRFSPHGYIFPIGRWSSNQLNQSDRLIYAPLAWITTDSGNGLVSSWCQAISWTNFD